LIALFPIWGMTLALLFWIVVRAITERPAGLAALGAVGALGWMALFGFGLAITAMSWAQAPWKQVDRLLTRVDGPTGFDVDPAALFVESRTTPGEKAALICTNEYLIADRAGVRNVAPIADPLSIAADSQVGEIVDAVRAAGGDKLFTCFKPFALPHEIDASLAARGFQRVATDRTLGISEWSTAPPG
jgi:hypothetical protein